jgi:hypothetical protein
VTSGNAQLASLASFRNHDSPRRPTTNARASRERITEINSCPLYMHHRLRHDFRMLCRNID